MHRGGTLRPEARFDSTAIGVPAHKTAAHALGAAGASGLVGSIRSDSRLPPRCAQRALQSSAPRTTLAMQTLVETSLRSATSPALPSANGHPSQKNCRARLSDQASEPRSRWLLGSPRSAFAER